jgi:uncharacterized protein (DUF924 family)
MAATIAPGGARTKGRMISVLMPPTPLAAEILDFWFLPRPGEILVNQEASPRPPHHFANRGQDAAERPSTLTRDIWFRKDDAFDAQVRELFGIALAAGIAGAFGEWCSEAPGSLARVILLDQFTRNAFRGTPDAFSGDPGALATAEDAIERGFDQQLSAHERWFLYMPFEHSESLAQQERGVGLFRALASDTGLAEPLPWAEHHCDVIRRFGRFPHRNAILGRTSTPEEIDFLRQPGSRF